MSATLDYLDGFLCVLTENAIEPKKWFAISMTDYAEVQGVLGRPVISVNQQEGVYVDEEGNVYQLVDKGETKPIAIEQLPGTEKTELEALLEASLKERKTNEQNGDSKKVQRRNRNNCRKQRVLQNDGLAPQLSDPEARASVEPAGANDGAGSEAPTQLNLRQKLAEVRRRIGYVQKRGHNERFNYSYVTAADIAGSVGDILSELGVVVIPRLEDISYESAAGRGEATRMARVVMAYTFADVDSGEEVVAKVAGQGLDPGDKAPYKAMTGALKYALLQSFLLATGDDPEDDRLDARFTPTNAERLISADQVRELQSLIDETGTELERVLAYYKVASLAELTETTHRRAVEILNRKLAKRSEQGTAHAQD